MFYSGTAQLNYRTSNEPLRMASLLRLINFTQLVQHARLMQKAGLGRLTGLIALIL